jgi:prophage antirepressor-like protein
MDLVKAFSHEQLDAQINIQGTHEDPLFQANQIGELLGFQNIHESLKDFNEEEKVTRVIATLGGKQKASFLTELGLYRLIGRSRKPLAVAFQRWVSKVLKEIRLKGKYELQEELESQRKLVEDAREAMRQSRHQELLHMHPERTAVTYRALIGKDRQKLGSTSNLAQRVKQLEAVYGTCILVDVVQCGNNKALERAFLDHPLVKPRRPLVVIDGKKHTELIQPDETLTHEACCKLLRKLAKKVEAGPTEVDRFHFQHEEKVKSLDVRLAEIELEKLKSPEIRMAEIELEMLRLRMGQAPRPPTSQEQVADQMLEDFKEPAEAQEEEVLHVEDQDDGVEEEPDGGLQAQASVQPEQHVGDERASAEPESSSAGSPSAALTGPAKAIDRFLRADKRQLTDCKKQLVWEIKYDPSAITRWLDVDRAYAVYCANAGQSFSKLSKNNATWSKLDCEVEERVLAIKDCPDHPGKGPLLDCGHKNRKAGHGVARTTIVRGLSIRTSVA